MTIFVGILYGILSLWMLAIILKRKAKGYSVKLLLIALVGVICLSILFIGNARSYFFNEAFGINKTNAK